MGMIVDFDKAAEYTRKLLKINNEKILEIKKYGEENKIPIITEEVLNFMIFQNQILTLYHGFGLR